MEQNEKSLEEINAEIEKELLQRLQTGEEPDVDEEVTISGFKYVMDIIIVIVMILIIITNIGILVWKFL